MQPTDEPSTWEHLKWAGVMLIATLAIGGLALLLTRWGPVREFFGGLG